MNDALRQPAYTTVDAAMYAGISYSQARSWLRGHVCTAGNRRRRKALIAGGDGAGQYASFLDLAELIVVRELRKVGLSIQRLRKLLPEIQDMLKVDDHPLATQRFYCNGTDVWIDRLGSMLELDTGGQLAIGDAVRHIADCIDFGEKGYAQRYRPPAGGEQVWIDPSLNFGTPVLRDHRLKTSVIYAAFVAEGRKTDEVAWWFKIEDDEVEAAVRFEESIRCRRPSPSTRISPTTSPRH